MVNAFNQVPKAVIPRSVFNRGHGYKTTFSPDVLVPFLVDEVLPGDSFKVNAEFLLRFNDLLRPFMDNLYINTYYFYCPDRLVWENFVRMMGEQDNPDDSTSYVFPKIELGAEQLTPDSIYCYMGMPMASQLQSGKKYRVMNLPFRMYNLIWNEWFRDQNLQNSLIVNKGDADDDPALYKLRHIGKKQDYFTSCLPKPQKGPEPTLPIGGQAPVLTSSTQEVGYDAVSGQPGNWGLSFYSSEAGRLADPTKLVGLNLGGQSGSAVGKSNSATLSAPFSLSASALGGMVAPANLFADLSGATAITINQMRELFAIQRLYERDMRGGTRYTEICQSHYGVINPDARLQRPEFLGGSRQRINVTSIPQTSSSTTASKQANLAGYSATHGSSGFTKSFTEHGFIIGLICVTCDLTYQQGIDRFWFRDTRFDVYWPALSHLGEQAVLSQEIYADGSDDDKLVFGYQERYAEYRYKPSKITGVLNSKSPLPLDQWHLSQDFDNRPVLNDEFRESHTPLDRVRALNDGENTPPFLLDSFIDMRCARPMPVHGVPGLIDHF